MNRRCWAAFVMAALSPSVVWAQFVWLEAPWQPAPMTIVPTFQMAPAAASPATVQSQYLTPSTSPTTPFRITERHYLTADETGRPLGPATAPDLQFERLMAVPGGLLIREIHTFDRPLDGAMAPVRKEGETKPADGAPKKLSLPEPGEALNGKPAGDPPASSTETRDAKPEGPTRELPSTKSYYPPTTTEAAIKVTGVFRSARGGSLLSNARLGFYDPAGKAADVDVQTDAFGRFQVALQRGSWRVFLMQPEGGRRYLQTVAVEPSENAVLSIDG